MSGRYRCGGGDEGGSAARDAAPLGDEVGSAARDAAPLPNNVNEGGDGDARAAAMAIEASRTSGGAPTAAIAGNTAAVVMTTDNLVQALPPLASIWKCAKIRQFETENKTKKWLCEWCPKGSSSFTGWNASKALWHVCKVSGKGIRPCSGFIPPEYARMYKTFLESKIVNTEARESE